MPLTQELIKKYTDIHPQFVKKLFDKVRFKQTYPGLSQQVEIVSNKIDQLGNDELKSVLHAFVTFYSVEEDEKYEKVVTFLEELHDKHLVTPKVESTKQGLNLGLSGPVMGYIDTIDI